MLLEPLKTQDFRSNVHPIQGNRLLNISTIFLGGFITYLNITSHSLSPRSSMFGLG